jgi:hypothetical protein
MADIAELMKRKTEMTSLNSDEDKVKRELDILKRQLQKSPENENLQEQYDQKLTKLANIRGRTPQTPSVLLDTPEKLAAAKPQPKAATSSTPSSNAPVTPSIPTVDSLSDYYEKIKPDVDRKIAQIKSERFEQMEKNERMQALGNVIMNLMQYVRLAGAPAGAPQPAIEMPRIDFSRLNEQQMKRMAIELDEAKEDLASKLQAKRTDIVTQRQERAAAERRAVVGAPDQDGIPKPVRSELKKVDKLRSKAIENLGDDDKLATTLRQLNVPEKEIDKLIDFGITDFTGTDSDEVEKRRKAVDQLTRGLVRQHEGQWYKRVPGGWERIK